MPNNDYILRSDALKAIRDVPPGNWSADRYKFAIWEVPAADVEPAWKWTPVTDAESLPKRSMPCLVACNQWGGEIVRKATYLYSENIFTEGGIDITEFVTHWMPSPEPPKGEENAD